MLTLTPIYTSMCYYNQFFLYSIRNEQLVMYAFTSIATTMEGGKCQPRVQGWVWLFTQIWK